MRRGDWVTCVSCGEESLYTCVDTLDFVCSVCGCHAFEEDCTDYRWLKMSLYASPSSSTR